MSVNTRRKVESKMGIFYKIVEITRIDGLYYEKNIFFKKANNMTHRNNVFVYMYCVRNVLRFIAVQITPKTLG